ncbi:MAG: ATP-binding cassette domain-containing protein [Acholeplasmataceae bacterium]
MDTCLVKLKEVYKYDIKKPFDFDIEPKDFILISGDNGKGKTTLTKLILGYIMPDRGHIESKTLNVGYLPEHIEFPLFMKVSRYLDILMKIKGNDGFESLMYMFKIPLFKSIYQLSHGNRQKLGIISACIGKPDLIILDEPMVALDIEGRAQFLDMLKTLKENGKTVMIISHYPSYILPLCNKHIKL